jgi:hypothetical protein
MPGAQLAHTGTICRRLIELRVITANPTYLIEKVVFSESKLIQVPAMIGSAT